MMVKNRKLLIKITAIIIALIFLGTSFMMLFMYAFS